MRDGVIIRYAEGPLHHEMIEVNRVWHERYADIHGFDILHFKDELGGITSAYGWRRYELMLLEMQEYRYVMMLESDTMVVDPKPDPRLCLIGRPLAMTYGSAGAEPHHFQTGVILAERNEAVRSLFWRVMEEKPDQHIPIEERVEWWKRKYCQQTVMHQLLMDPCRRDLVHDLGPRWNSQRDEGAIIRAWHGMTSEKAKLEAIRKKTKEMT